MIQIYADGADMKGILEAAANPNITGFTTNPTLMKQAGVTNYMEFAHEVISKLAQARPGTNISLEVFADDYEGMKTQAEIIASWGEKYNYDVFVKIPVMNTKGFYNYDLINELSSNGIKVNVTAVFTPGQIDGVLAALSEETPSILSIFAGRIADASVDPTPIIDYAVRRRAFNEQPMILWASCREVFNYEQAKAAGCDIITMTFDQIKKLEATRGKSLEIFSQETVQMFFNDAQKSGYTIV